MSANLQEHGKGVFFDDRIASTAQDQYIADAGLAEFGRKEIRIAETEMPGLVQTRGQHADDQPLKGERVGGGLQMPNQAAVPSATVVAGGGGWRHVVRRPVGVRASCYPRTTMPPPPPLSRSSPCLHSRAKRWTNTGNSSIVFSSGPTGRPPTCFLTTAAMPPCCSTWAHGPKRTHPCSTTPAAKRKRPCSLPSESGLSSIPAGIQGRLRTSRA